MPGIAAPFIEGLGLDCYFGRRAAIRGVDLVVAPGQIHGLLGPRCAGKSTLLRILAGDLAPTAGRLTIAADVALVAESADVARLRPIEAMLNPSTRQRVALARALAGAPQVLLVDEPAAGFDAETEAMTRSVALRHAADGGAVVWAVRRLDALQGLASNVTLLVGGRIRFSGSVDALRSRALAGSAPAVHQPLRHAA